MKNNYETIQECELFSAGTDLSKQKYDIKQVFKIIQQAKKEVFDDWIRRLSSASQEDAIFPLAGQDFRNKVIEFIEGEKYKLYQNENNKRRNT